MIFTKHSPKQDFRNTKKKDKLKSKIICKFAQLQIFFRELIHLFILINFNKSSQTNN